MANQIGETKNDKNENNRNIRRTRIRRRRVANGSISTQEPNITVTEEELERRVRIALIQLETEGKRYPKPQEDVTLQTNL